MPRRQEMIARPIPIANTSVRIPAHLAARKWPSSCTKIKTPNPKMISSRLVVVVSRFM